MFRFFTSTIGVTATMLLAVVAALLLLTACGGGGDAQDDREKIPGPPDCENHPELCI